ncbi:substrate-binding periplasmic protein [Shewanella litoralis]|uniref:ABC transporter n=1 Tax=Shewanella litoralis TaxID=2282700 RepID=A0ABQ2R2H4_9GAMM|nr:ABC transporter substrate-binding protein [Shewanella litoralis]GGQ04684.1 ABC transporter [Shewanella litoralis]
MMTAVPMELKQFCLCILVTLCCASGLLADTLELSTLEWPPFSGSELPEQGINSQIISKALSFENHTLAIAVLPWNRAARSVTTGQAVGYYPTYFNPANGLLFSNPIGASPIVLIERKNNPIIWDKVSDLNQYELGVLKGYINTVEIDEMIANGSQKFETGIDEKQNILKLAAGRIDTIIMDVNVFEYLKSDPQVAKVAPLLQVNPKIVQDKTLHITFNNTQEGKKWCDIVNQGLAQFDVHAMQDVLLNPVEK